MLKNSFDELEGTIPPPDILRIEHPGSPAFSRGWPWELLKLNNELFLNIDENTGIGRRCICHCPQEM